MRHTTPHFMAYFGCIFFANMGGGVGQNYFHIFAVGIFSGGHVCRTKLARMIFRGTNFLTKYALKFSPKFLSLYTL